MWAVVCSEFTDRNLVLKNIFTATLLSTVAAMSVVVATETPVAEPAMGPPMVAPVSVSVIAPAATSAVAVTMYWGEVPVVKVAKLVPTAPIVPKM